MQKRAIKRRSSPNEGVSSINLIVTNSSNTDVVSRKSATKKSVDDTSQISRKEVGQAGASRFNPSLSIPAIGRPITIPPFIQHRDVIEKERNLMAIALPQIKRYPGPTVSANRFFREPGSVAMAISGSPNGATLVTNNIVLGGRDDASNADLLRSLGVTHVLNVAQQVPNYFPDRLIYKKIPLLDSPTVRIVDALPASASYLRYVESKGGRVLIHCVAGVSRSVAILVMYLISAHNQELRYAYEYILHKRPYITPNDGFKLQMALFEVQQLGYSSVADPMPGRAWDFYDWNCIKRDVPRRPPSTAPMNHTSGACVLS